MKGFQTLDFPIVNGLAFDVLYQPAATIEHLGGDWYDIFTLPDGRVAFTIRGCMRSGSRRSGENGTGKTGY
jgi:serine phosphatase RsbU (regulator of sigma subunit)